MIQGVQPTTEEGSLPAPRFAQAVLVEVAAAAAAAGLAAGDGWSIAGVTGGAVLLLLTVVPLRGRWAYQALGAWLGLRRRRAGVRGPDVQSLLGGFTLVPVPGGGSSEPFVAVRTGDRWAVPLALDPAGHAAVPPQALRSLLLVEDVPLASVRTVTVFAPAPAGAARAVTGRYCVLTLDAALAADALADRGGSDAGLLQVLRRCALRAEQVLAAAGTPARRLGDAAVTAAFDTCLGTGALLGTGTVVPGTETWREVRVGGAWSVGFAADDAGERAERLAATAPGATTAVCTVLRRGPRGAVTGRGYLRVSGAGPAPDARAFDGLARAGGARWRRLDGEQVRALEATLPVALAG